MATVNEELLDLSVRHQVGIQRLSAGIVKKIIPILNQADAELVKKLLARAATLEGSFTSQRLKYLLDAVREINRDANVALSQTLRDELSDLAKYEADFQARLMTNTVGLDVVTPSASLLRAVVTSRPLQGRFLRDWVKDLETGQRKRLTQAIQQGMVQGESVDQIVRRVRGTRALNFKDGILEVNRRQARNLVRTATNHVSNASREEFFKENDDLVKGVQWVSTLDTRTCPTCMALDGKVFKIGQGPRPPRHPSCRCATAPVTKSWRELGLNLDEMPEGTRASMNGQVPETQTYNEWLKGQSAKVQDEALGATRGRLFRSGGLSVDRFTDSRGNILNLDELRTLESEAFDKAA